MTAQRITATYRIETAYPIREAVETMAGEQSTGTFVRLPGETDELRELYGAHIERITELDEVAEPSLPGAGVPKGPSGKPVWRRAEVVLSWSLDNFGASLPNLVATVAGNLFELRPFSGLRLLDITLPEAFAAKYPGPKFGVAGTRRLSGVEGRPLIGTIVKPSVGFGPEQTADLVKVLCEAGIDFIKDDELQADGPHCPFDARARAVMRVIEDHAQRTGKKAMYAFNITGDLDEMRRRHDLVLELGGTCVMASLNSVGLTGMIELGAVQPVADPRPPQRLGLSVQGAVAGLVLCGVAEDLAAGRCRPHACQRPSEQVLRERRERDRLGQGLPDADVREQALHRDAGVLVRPVGAAGSGHLCGAWVAGPDLRGGRRHHGASRRAGGRLRQPAGVLGGRPGRHSAG